MIYCQEQGQTNIDNMTEEAQRKLDVQSGVREGLAGSRVQRQGGWSRAVRSGSGSGLALGTQPQMNVLLAGVWLGLGLGHR